MQPTFTTHQTTHVQLRRPHQGRMIAGVAAGLADHFDVDVAVVRVGLAVLTIFGALGIPFYLAAWLFVPDECDDESVAERFLGHRVPGQARGTCAYVLPTDMASEPARTGSPFATHPDPVQATPPAPPQVPSPTQGGPTMSHRVDAARYRDPHYRRGFDPSMRIGDAERNEVTDALGDHFSAGRLDQTELDERLGRASAAKTGADLAGVLVDLPPLGTPVTSASSPPARRWRTALWMAVVLLLVVLSVPWRLGPWGWWFPHPPLFLAALVLAMVWVRGRRRRWRSVSGT